MTQNASKLPTWAWHRPDHNAIECRDCGADKGLGAGDFRTALAEFRHHAGCSNEPGRQDDS